ncbi:hypothetical protein FQA39_LY00602 [Lamprigera yunnana]|nr:hypothetical protein FQA39_LY00602 [Lamprigera yunnana]
MDNNYTIRLATVDDRDSIMDHLKAYFFREEPVNASINLIDSLKHLPESANISVKVLQDGVSFIAIDEYGEIVGVSLNSLRTRFKNEEKIEICNPLLEEIFKLFDYVDHEADIFHRYPNIDKFISIHIISVSSAWRNRGVALELVYATRQMAKELSIPLIRTDCTSYFSKRLFEKLGYHCIYAKGYNDYLRSGKPIFTPKPPHKEIAVMVLST